MKFDELMSQARDTITVGRVFGDPIDKDGVTVIPVAHVMGGAGGGEGIAPFPGGEAPAGSPPPGGAGMGFGVRAVPAGVYVIRDGVVRWEPALDLNRAVLLGVATLVVTLLVVRSIVRSRAVRPS